MERPEGLSLPQPPPTHPRQLQALREALQKADDWPPPQTAEAPQTTWQVKPWPPGAACLGPDRLCWARPGHLCRPSGQGWSGGWGAGAAPPCRLDLPPWIPGLLLSFLSTWGNGLLHSLSPFLSLSNRPCFLSILSPFLAPPPPFSCHLSSSISFLLVPFASQTPFSLYPPHS